MSFEAVQIDEKCALQFKIDMVCDIDADNFPIKIDILLLLAAGWWLLRNGADAEC